MKPIGRALALVLVAGLGAGAVAVWDSPSLDLHKVEVGSNQRVAANDVVVASELTPRDHLLRISTSKVAARVERSPWVATADVERILPSSVRITVVERKPVAIVVAGPSSYMVDGEGVVLERVAGNGGSKLPVIAELPVGSLEPGRRIGLPQYRQALTILASLPGGMAQKVDLVRAPSTETITLELAGGPAILFGPAEDLGDKRFALEAVTEKAAAEGMTLASIDVRVPKRPAALPK